MSAGSGEFVPIEDVEIAWRHVVGLRTGFPLDDPWEPTTPHESHRYDFRCAVCRAGESADALRAVLAVALSHSGASRTEDDG